MRARLWRRAMPAHRVPPTPQVCMVLRYVADEITLYSDDIAVCKRTALCVCLCLCVQGIRAQRHVCAGGLARPLRPHASLPRRAPAAAGRRQAPAAGQPDQVAVRGAPLPGAHAGAQLCGGGGGGAGGQPRHGAAACAGDPSGTCGGQHLLRWGGWTGVLCCALLWRGSGVEGRAGVRGCHDCAATAAPVALCCLAAEWVPVGRLKDAGLINACGFMLSTTEFRDSACDVMRQVAGARRAAGTPAAADCPLRLCQAAGAAASPPTLSLSRPPRLHLRPAAGRKQAEEAPEVFGAVMAQIAEALINAAAALLSPAAQVLAHTLAPAAGAPAAAAALCCAACTWLRPAATHAAAPALADVPLQTCRESWATRVSTRSLARRYAKPWPPWALRTCTPSATQVRRVEGAARAATRWHSSNPAAASCPAHARACHAPPTDRKLAFLQHMLAFAQHPFLLLADKALPMWVKLLQDANASVSHATAAAAAANGPGGSAAGPPAAAPPRQPTVQLPPQCVEALMSMAAEQLQQRGHVPSEDEEFPPYFDTFAVRVGACVG